MIKVWLKNIKEMFNVTIYEVLLAVLGNTAIP